MKKILLIAILFSVSCKKLVVKNPSSPSKPVTKYYRIKEVDKDGKVMYSKVITIQQK